MILETNQFILISSTSEIYKFNLSSNARIISFVIAFCIFSASMMLIGVSFALIYYHAEQSNTENSDIKIEKFGEFYLDLKKQKKFKISCGFLLLRRFVFIILLITLVSKSSITARSILTWVQIIYLIFVIYLRPFEEIKLNIIEIINEIYFTCLFSSLLFLNSRSDWSTTITNI